MALRPEFELMESHLQQLQYNLGVDQGFLISVRNHIELCGHIVESETEKSVITQTIYWWRKRATLFGLDMNPELSPIKILTGREELKEILASVIDALCEADLTEEVRVFHDRVIAQALSDYSIVLDYEQVSEDTFRCKYKPMVELALLEIKTAATAPEWTKAMRKERIAEILDMAGF